MMYRLFGGIGLILLGLDMGNVLSMNPVAIGVFLVLAGLTLIGNL